MADDINNPEEVVEEEVAQPDTQDATTTDDQATGTEGQVQEPETVSKPEAEESFLGNEDKEKLETDLANHPEWKPFIDAKMKQLQSGFTKAMQSVPKKYRDSAYLKSIEEKALLYDKLDRDPNVVRIINDYIHNADKDRKAEAKGDQTDFLDEFKKNATDEEKAFIERFEPLFSKMIAKAVKPIADETNLTKEQSAQKELSDKYSDRFNINIMDKESWATIKEYKAQHPTLSYEDCLYLAVRDIYPDTFEKAGADKVVQQIKKQTKDQVVIGSSRGSGSSEGQYTQAQIDAMSPEEYAQAMGLQRAPELN